MRATPLLFLIALASGCPSDGEVAQPSDVGTQRRTSSDTGELDVSSPEDASATADVMALEDTTKLDDTAPPVDAGDPEDAQQPDVPQDTADSATTDSPSAEDAVDTMDAVDAAEPAPDSAAQTWPGDAPEGQCTSGADCPSGLCNADAPGGLCQGCGQCIDGGYECNFGTCNLWCDSQDECPIGLKCSQGGVCTAVLCDNDESCAWPYVCRDGVCSRPLCADGCPEPFTCSGSVCVEP